MAGLIVYEQLKEIREELEKKLDELKFRIAMEDVSNTIDEIKNSIKVLDTINIKELVKKLSYVSDISDDKLESLVDLINKYDEAVSTSDTVLEAKVNEVLLKSGVLDKFKDELISIMDRYKQDILNKIRTPVKLKDIDIQNDGTLDIDIEVLDVIDFEIPIYKYDEDGNILIKCGVNPTFENGKVIIKLSDKVKKELGFVNGFDGWKTSVQVLTKIKEQ